MRSTASRNLILAAAVALCAASAAAEPARGVFDCTRSGCHQQPRGDAAFVHELVEAGDCAACHEAGASDGALHPEVAGAPTLGSLSISTHRDCQPCHDDHQLRHAETPQGGDCIDCHAPHGSDAEALLRGSRGEICLSCHAESFEPSRRKRSSPGESEPRALAAALRQHGVVAEDSCVECHLVHGGSEKGLLRGAFPAANYAHYDRAAYSTCLESCHPAELVEAQPTRTATRFRNGEDNLHYRHVSAPSRGRSCRLCHAPHQAQNAALVLSAMSFGKERLTLEFSAGETGGQCQSTCHLPIAYDREVAIPSRMRVVDPTPNSEKKP